MANNEDSMISSSISDVVVASSSQGVSSGKTNQASQHLGKQRQYWRDIILGVNDGLVSTFLLVAGVVGGGLETKDILLTAISGSLAGAVSMFAGEFVATRAQESVMTGELRLESEHIKNHHSEEIEELHGLLTLIGIPEEDSSDDESITSTLRGKLITHYSNDQDSLFKIMKALEFGVIDEERRSPVVAALASFFCFIAGSMSSTIPFIFVKTPTAGLYASIIATFICLFAVGLIKTYATRENWIKSCFDNLFIPTLGGAIAFGIARSRDGAILVEAKTSGVEGNYPQVTSQLLDELVKYPSLVPIGVRKTFTTNIITNSSKSNLNVGDIEMSNYWGGRRTVDVDYGDVLGTEYEDCGGSEYLFHVVQGESSYFLCLSDDTDGIQHRINFGFLLSVQKEFTQKYTPNKIEKANAYGFEKSFSQKLSQMMHHSNTTRYSTGVDPNTAKLTSEIESLKKIMGNNIELLMNRGDELDKIVERSDDLLIESKVFSKRGKRLKKVMKRKAMLYKMVIVGFFLVTIYFMIAKICGFDLTCTSSDSS